MSRGDDLDLPVLAPAPGPSSSLSTANSVDGYDQPATDNKEHVGKDPYRVPQEAQVQPVRHLVLGRADSGRRTLPHRPFSSSGLPTAAREKHTGEHFYAETWIMLWELRVGLADADRSGVQRCASGPMQRRDVVVR